MTAIQHNQSVRGRWQHELLPLGIISALALGTTAIFSWLDIWFAGMVAAAMILILFCVFLYPHFWIATVVIGWCYFLIEAKEKGVGIIEGTLAAYYVGGIILWMFYQIFINRQRLILHWVDFLYVFYFVFSLTNVVVAIGYGTDPILWFREWAVGLLALYYFPLRKYISDKKTLMWLLTIAAVVVTFLVAMSLKKYMTIANNSEYAYQISGVRTNPHLYMMATITGMAVTILQRRVLIRTIAGTFTGIFMIGVVSTYSRTTWVETIFLLFLMFVVVARQYKVRMMTLFGSVIVISALLLPLVFGNLATVIPKVLANRFSKSTVSKSDPSLMARVYETKAALNHIENNPISGYGLNTSVDAYSPITKFTIHSPYIHNGFVSMVYRFGIPIALVIYGLFISSILRSIWVWYIVQDRFWKMIALAAMLGLMGLFIENITATMFYFRNAQMVMAFSIAMSEIAYIQHRKLQQSNVKNI